MLCIGQFLECVDTDFNGIHLGMQMNEQMLELQMTYRNPYLVMLFESKRISRPTFALILPGAKFNVQFGVIFLILSTHIQIILMIVK